MSEKTIRYIVYLIKAGLFVLPVLSLLVAGNFFAKVFLPGAGDLFFPFITAKNFFFRIAVEVLLFFWVFAAVFDKSYRPKRSHLLLALTVFLFVLILAAVFGENPYRSFWSNYERMEGLVAHIHLFLYFLIAGCILKTRKDWRNLFVSILSVGFIVVIYGFFQYFGKAEIHQGGVRLDATFGNATYLAIFMIFMMALTALFFYWLRNIWARIGLGALFLMEFYIMFLTATRGAILGFIGGLVILATLFSFFARNKKIRYGALAALLLLASLVAGFILVKDNSYIKTHPVLSRFASISFTETTTESRLTIWGMSFEAFQKYPFLGRGPENYNLVFNEYFKPILWKQEPWFDRSHNIVFDWLIAAGGLGFLAYWSIFGAALFLVWRGFKKGQFGLVESVIITSLFAAYSFHNLFVFDNITSYYLFFTVLAFVHSMSLSSDLKSETNKQNRRMVGEEMGFAGYLAITFTFLVVIFSFYFVNLKPIFAGQTLIEAMRLAQAGQPVGNVLKSFDEIFSYKTFGSGEAREQLASYANSLYFVEKAPGADKIKALTKAAEEMEKQSALSGDKDVRYLMFLAPLYTKLNKHEDALRIINKALELSPNKQQIYFVAADIYINAGQMDKAVEMIETAYELDTTYAEAGKNLAILYIINSKREEAEDILIKQYGTKIIADTRLVNAYAQINDFETVRDVWFELIKINPNNAQYYVSLAATYLKLDERDKAIEALQKAAELNPDFKEEVEGYIEAIRNGQL